MGLITIAKQALCIIQIVSIESRDDKFALIQDERIFIQDLIICFFGFVPYFFFTLCLFFTLILFICLSFVDLFLSLFTCFRYRLFRKITLFIQKKWEAKFQGDIERLSRFRGSFSESRE